MSELKQLQDSLATFAKERNWEQFHSPKNLSMALAAEVGEVLEHFQWLSEKESSNLTEQQKYEIGLELADVFMYLLQLADKSGIDLMQASEDKIMLNEKKYPVDKSWGNATKYDKF